MVLGHDVGFRFLAILSLCLIIGSIIIITVDIVISYVLVGRIHGDITRCNDIPLFYNLFRLTHR